MWSTAHGSISLHLLGGKLELQFLGNLSLCLRNQGILQIHQTVLVIILAHLVDFLHVFLRQRVESIVQAHLIHLLFHPQQGRVIIHFSGHNVELAAG